MKNDLLKATLAHYMDLSNFARPEDVLDAAAASKRGVVLVFTDQASRDAYRSRLYRAMRKAEEATPGEPSPWVDLALAHGEMPTELKITRADAKSFGLVEVKEL